MIGPILLAISWLLLRLEGKRLEALGFNAPGKRARQFLAGFVIAALAAVVQQVGLSLAAGVSWQMNPEINLPAVLNSIRWNLNSVLYEELLFRGYLLYQAMRWLGPRNAVLLDAAAFGVYHWFSYGAFGNPVMMGFVFLFTGAFGFMLAVAFVKTESIFAPIGLHLGWNLTSYLVFSTGPLGRELLVPANGAPRMEAVGFPDFLFDVGVPLALIVGVSWLLLRRRPDNSLESDMLSRILIAGFLLIGTACSQDVSYRGKEYDRRIFQYQLDEIKKLGMSKDEYLMLTKPFSKWDSRPINDAEVWIMGSFEPSSTVPNLYWGAIARSFGVTAQDAVTLPDQFVKIAYLNKEKHKKLISDHHAKVKELITLVSKSDKKIMVNQKQLQRVDNLIYENGAFWRFQVPGDSPFPISDTLKSVNDSSFSELENEILSGLFELEMHGVYKMNPFIVFIKDGLLDNSYGFIVGDSVNTEKLGHLFRIKLFEKVQDNIFFYIAS